MSQEESSWSIRTITIALSIVVAIFFWAVMARSYEQSLLPAAELYELEPGEGMGRRSRGLYLLIKISVISLSQLAWSAVTQIPNLFSVLFYNLQHRMVLIIAACGTEFCILAGGLGLAQLEQKLDPTASRKKKKKKRKGTTKKKLRVSDQ